MKERRLRDRVINCYAARDKVCSHDTMHDMSVVRATMTPPVFNYGFMVVIRIPGRPCPQRHSHQAKTISDASRRQPRRVGHAG